MKKDVKTSVNRPAQKSGKKYGNRNFEKQKEVKSDKCALFGKCGACHHLNLSYEEQLKKKKSVVENLLKPYCKVERIIGMDKPFHYRNKVLATFSYDKKGRPISGMYEEKSHRVVPMDSCLLNDEKADEIIVSIRGLLKSFKIRTYDEDTGYGLLRHVLVRIGKSTGQIMVVLVLASPILPGKNNFVKALRSLHPEIGSIVINVNPRHSSAVLGNQEIVIYGPGFIEDKLQDKIFRISPKSFYQINPVQTEKLYSTAIDFAGLTGKETVLDAYSGTGTIGICASNKAKKVLCVELNKDAVRDAIVNAKRNNVTNIEMYNQDAGEFLLNRDSGDIKIDVVFMDPPRSGSDEKFLGSLCQYAPKKIVYVSCNPETLARDLAYLTKKGYEAKKAVAVDMFPHTSSIETVALLSRQKVTEHIYIDVNIADLPKTTRTTATYPEIKAYIKDKYGLCVSSLNIAQIKEKHGFEKRENYNKGKEGHRVPKCPPEKEKAIEEAFKHFGML